MTQKSIVSNKECYIPSLYNVFSLPRIETIHEEAIEAFRKAMQLDMNFSNLPEEQSCEMFGLYGKAYAGGIVDAGINLLVLILKINASQIMRQLEETDDFDLDAVDLYFQGDIQKLTNDLIEMNHPAGDFFVAVALMYGLVRTDEMSVEAASAEGLAMMEMLYEAENKYAVSFINQCKETQ